MSGAGAPSWTTTPTPTLPSGTWPSGSTFAVLVNSAMTAGDDTMISATSPPATHLPRTVAGVVGDLCQISGLVEKNLGRCIEPRLHRAGGQNLQLRRTRASAKRQPGERCGDRSGSIELLHCDLRFVEANST